MGHHTSTSETNILYKITGYKIKKNTKMTVWYHLTTIFRRCLFAYRHRLFLPIAGIILLVVAFITTLAFTSTAFAAPNVSRTIGFQGRLLNSAEAPVPDGYYNVQFKLYEGGTGTEEGNPNGELVWTETHVNNGDPEGGVQVKNGFLSVDLGSVTPFGSNVDWDNDTIWLSINVAGNTVACSDFGDEGCEADGEMLPMRRITATPYAINSGSVNGKTANDLVQLGQGIQTDSTTGSSIFINKTGDGNLIQLQNAADDVFVVNKHGDIEFGGSRNHLIGVQDAPADTEGAHLGISAANGGAGDGSNGGTLSLQGGNAGGLNGNGGDVIISGGSGEGTGADGLVIISTPTFKTSEQQVCDEDCIVTQSSIDNNGAIVLSAGEPGLTFTFNDPTRTTAGRVIYVTSSTISERFTLAINGGVGADNTITMKPNMTATLFWNGSDWTTSSLSSGTEAPLQRGTADNVQIGTGSEDANTTLITLDKSTSAPVITDESLVGSMYYDTTIGAVQCYEADGWGNCGASPDTFVSLSPEYASAVTQGSNDGTFTSSICSDELGINNGTNNEPAICGTNETHNFYGWTTDQVTTQSKSIFVTYELPNTFKEFVEGSTSLLAKTDSVDAHVSYQVYRKSSTGLTACGTPTTASTGVQSSWLTEVTEGTADPAECGFEAGDSIVIKVTLQSVDDAHAYASTLKFAFSNK